MKVFKFPNGQSLTNRWSEVTEREEFGKVQKGKWFHFHRTYAIKSSEGYGLVSMNFFERLARNICINPFKKVFAGKSVKIISAEGPSIVFRSLHALEGMNAKTTRNAGYKGDIIFADITSKGGKEAIRVLKNLEKDSSKKCHLGVACFVNYSLAAANKADKIILLDYDPVVVKFNRIARDALLTSSCSHEYKQKLIEACQKDPEISKRKFYPKGESVSVANLSYILNLEESFLSTEEDFQYIKKLAKDNKIHIFQKSIYDQREIKEIVQLAKREGYTFDSLFISNVYDWDSNPKKRELLKKNLQALCNDQTKIVEVVPNKGEHYVNIVYYKDPQSQALYDSKILREGKGKEVYPGALLSYL